MLTVKIKTTQEKNSEKAALAMIWTAEGHLVSREVDQRINNQMRNSLI